MAIRRSIEETRLGVAEKPPKSGKSRVVALTIGAIETLRRLRISDADARGLGSVAGSRYVFAADDGAALAPHVVTDGCRAIARLAGIVPAAKARVRASTRAGRKAAAIAPHASRSREAGGVTFHSLRHTCATMLLSQGVHPKIVQEMLGHSSVAITMDLLACDALAAVRGGRPTRGRSPSPRGRRGERVDVPSKTRR